MVDVITEIVIKSPLNEVAEYAAEPDNAPEWYVNIKSVDWRTPKPLAKGSRIAFKAHFLGRDLAYVYQIVELIPYEKLVMQTAEGPFPMKTIYTWTALDDRTTRMTLRNTGNPTGFSKMLAPFMQIMMRRANKKDLKQIKIILEKRLPG